MKRNQTGLVALCYWNGQQTLTEIHILKIQSDGFTYPHSCRRQQPEQRRIGGAFEWILHINLSGSLDQFNYIRIIEDVGSWSAILAG